MRLPCVPSHALRGLRTQSSFFRNGQRHSLHTETKNYNAAVIGGGITGLTAAARLSQDPECSKVTLYEKSGRLGGWMLSERIPVDGGDVVFEYGPRTLRTAAPACLPLIDLILDMDLHDEVLFTKKNTPAARNRYIYYPDHLVRMPGPDPETGALQNAISILGSVLSEPVFKNLIKGVVTEPLKLDLIPGPTDESVAEFVARRLHPDVADNLVSAVMHGIYAGDIDKLSAQALLGQIRTFETPDRGVIGSLLNIKSSGRAIVRVDDSLARRNAGPLKNIEYWKVLKTLVARSSALTFKNGVGQLSDALAAALDRDEKVEVITNADVRAISQNPETSDLIVDYGEQSQTYNRVIATNPAPILAQQLSQTTQKDQKFPQSTINCLNQHNYATTVMVVNLYYPNPNLVPVTGFGYLIPRSIPYDQNPERALGVIFGSDSSVGQDTAPGTKLTVMFGGHWWDDWIESDYPDHDTAVEMARSLLKRHLNITDEPTLARSKLQRNAIPQYTVGHVSRMQELSRSVRNDFNKRLTLAGSWYGGVGITDCVRQAYIAATLGVGAKKLDLEMNNPGFDSEEWVLEGGLPMAPVQWVDVPLSEQ
ncbi:oxygen-dependent protoporphyrinogen oxidase [Aspergillus ruber CBS 135680]|uniref:Protoporphyrinogen oxidase n=1 Tax=Aspergillus ruber (strain CBS 135680) TaxID=1388766 RepID=A0A017SFN9_ASPRC|nr:putative protoporphyrinogen oxidase [Aspergillus ruber CBS 135680]EYE95060.1 putative protoporphyrinogen oxidase [Aspergillus ruber CBS 135680]